MLAASLRESCACRCVRRRMDDFGCCLETQPSQDDLHAGRDQVFLLRLEVELWLQKDEAHLDKVHVHYPLMVFRRILCVEN
jgi:hypothetical protein